MGEMRRKEKGPSTKKPGTQENSHGSGRYHYIELGKLLLLLSDKWKDTTSGHYLLGEEVKAQARPHVKSAKRWW